MNVNRDYLHCVRIARDKYSDRYYHKGRSS